MTQSFDAALESDKHEAQRLLGKCMLQLQAYERATKAIAQDHSRVMAFSKQGALETSDAVTDDRRTLGCVVNTLLGSFLNNEDNPRSPETPSLTPSDGSWAAMRYGIRLSASEFSRIEDDLKAFVALRNDLVHNFVDQHNLNSQEDCQAAIKALSEASERITRHWKDLRGWVDDMLDARKMMAEALNSGAVQEWLIHGKIHWPYAKIIHAVREVAAEIAVDGWAPITKTGTIVVNRYPDELPAHYDCNSWGHLIHESRLFEIRYLEINGQRIGCFRDKPVFAKSTRAIEAPEPKQVM